MPGKGLSEAQSLPGARSMPSPATRAVGVFEALFLQFLGDLFLSQLLSTETPAI